MKKPSRADGGFVWTKAEDVETFRAAWAIERDWRAEMRALTAYHDAEMSPFVAMVAWEGYDRPTEFKLRCLIRFTQGLGLDQATVREIYEAAGRDAIASGASDDERMAEVRKRMPETVR